MKTRNGFVSNSSASSFIVRWYKKEKGKKKEIYLSPVEVKLLKEYPFRPTSAISPEGYNGFESEKEVKIGKLFFGEVNLGYDVSCNEYCVINFLLKNNIAFRASGHYGYQNYFYDKDSKYLYIIENFGLQADNTIRYENITFDQLKNKWNDKGFQKVSVKKFLKDNEWWGEK